MLRLYTKDEQIEVGGDLGKVHGGDSLGYDERVTSVVFTWTEYLESVEFWTNYGRSIQIGSGHGIH